MATFTTPLPAPIKNDWLPTGDNPRLSPPSPGGPRKNAPVQQVCKINIQEAFSYLVILVCRDHLEVPEDEVLHLHQLVVDLHLLFRTDREVMVEIFSSYLNSLYTFMLFKVMLHQFRAGDLLDKLCQLHSFLRKYLKYLCLVFSLRGRETIIIP